QQPLSVSELVKVLGPIVDTLETAHRAGILHRDLKPANIFLMSEHAGAGVRLLDFGLVRLRSANPLTAAGTVLGSPSYIAPEVWKGSSGGLDQRVDVYSFGVVVYRALSGRLPFETAASLTDKFIMATTAARPSLLAHRPDLPLDVDHWIQEAMAIDRDHRFTTIRAAWNALLASLETSPTVLELPTEPANERPEAPEAQPGGLFGAWRAVSTAVRRFALGDEQQAPLGGGEASLVTQMLQQSALSVPEPPPSAEPAEAAETPRAPPASAR